ncbi:MAG TPA: hypothetical protein VJ233_00495 [Hyphomicrobiaceae bacterium]|nr:hypothetical protein [Hyphomicrobiaceae bacterium]
MPPQAVLDIVACDPPFDRLPLTIEQKSSRISAIIMLMLLVPALLVVLVPTGLLVAYASSSLGVAADHPGAAAQVLVGIGLWTALFVPPAKRIVQRFGTVRRIQVDTGAVTIGERGLFGSRRWSTPLSEYIGITRHLRSTLSGLRHELILVHGEPRKSVLLHSGDLASPPTIEQATGLLGLPEIQARELYRRRTLPRAPAAVPAFARHA